MSTIGFEKLLKISILQSFDFNTRYCGMGVLKTTGYGSFSYFIYMWSSYTLTGKLATFSQNSSNPKNATLHTIQPTHLPPTKSPLYTTKNSQIPLPLTIPY